MSARYFLDTNLLLYTFDKRYERKREISDALIRHGLESKAAVISYQVIQEFYNAMFKRFPAAQTREDAELYLKNVLQPMLSVESSVPLFESGLAIHDRYKFNWYDCLIVAAALQARCDVLYTEDLQDGQKLGNLVVTNPFL